LIGIIGELMGSWVKLQQEYTLPAKGLAL
jgi:hypothetical protein